MSYAQLIFSPTGGTKKTADALSGPWGVPVETIDLCDRKKSFSQIAFQPEDLVLLAVPSYGGRVPALAAQRLSQVQGGGARAVLLCVYGNRAYEDTLAELYDLAADAGFSCIAAVAAIAEHSIMHQYAAGRPDAQDREVLNGFSQKILDRAKAGDLLASQSVPGDRPYRKAGAVPLVPKAGKDCTACGLCAKQCPAGAIDPERVKTADSKRCISGMRCVVNCPHSARKVNGAMVSAAALAMKKVCSVRKENELFL